MTLGVYNRHFDVNWHLKCITFHRIYSSCFLPCFRNPSAFGEPGDGPEGADVVVDVDDEDADVVLETTEGEEEDTGFSEPLEPELTSEERLRLDHLLTEAFLKGEGAESEFEGLLEEAARLGQRALDYRVSSENGTIPQMIFNTRMHVLKSWKSITRSK